MAWQKAMDLVTATYRATAGFPKGELFGLTSQLRRAAVSIPSNIAEGLGRLTSGETKQFPGRARGSNFELQTQLEIAKALELGDSQLISNAERLSHEVGKMIFGMLEAIGR